MHDDETTPRTFSLVTSVFFIDEIPAQQFVQADASARRGLT